MGGNVASLGIVLRSPDLSRDRFSTDTFPYSPYRAKWDTRPLLLITR